MKRSLTVLVCSVLATVLLVAGCSSAAPAPTAPPAPKPTEPAKAAAPAAQPTAAPAQPAAPAAPKVAFPEKGKTITIIVPFPAGGTTDIAARVLGSYMEKDLGVPVQVVNKPGASSQTGLTEFARSKPDGYTLAYFILQNAIPAYLDPDRKAAFARKDLKPIGMVGEDPKIIAVRSDSPYKNVKELLDGAKEKNGTMTFGAGGILSPEHIWGLQLQQAAGVKFQTVQFDGIAPTMTALLGGHVDFITGSLGALAGPMKDKQVRALAIADRQANPLVPDIPTIDSQGFKVYCLLSKAVAVPAETPKEIADILARSVEKVMGDPEHKKKIMDASMDFRFTNAANTAAYWDDLEKIIGPLIALAKQQ